MSLSKTLLGKTFEVSIEKLSLGGNGIARHEGLVLFVPFSAPGDHVLVRVCEQKNNYVEAEIEKILHASPSRVEAPCPVFGRCGGCNWQHISSTEQLKQKQLIVEEQLKHFLKKEIVVLPIIPSPKDYRYRNRIQLKYQAPELGFYARKSHDVVGIDDCPVSEEKIAQKIPVLKAQLQKQKAQEISKIEVFLDEKENVQSVQEDSPYEGVGFSQVNRFQNKNLLKTVLLWAGDQKYSEIWDLYAGSGNFTFPLLEKFPSTPVVAAELNEKTVKKAQDLIRLKNMSAKKVRFLLVDVELFLKRNPVPEQALVVLDPPRLGCSENTIRYLSQQRMKRLLYVSCNPSALGRDLQRFFALSPHPWKLARIQPFDMFPQTDHVEVLAELILEDHGYSEIDT